jgi:DNA-directed RNA polymerase I, II, and III subunit RPABC2
MSDFTDFNELTKEKTNNEDIENEQSGDESDIELDKINDDDDDDDDDGIDYENESDPDVDDLEGQYDEEAGEPIESNDSIHDIDDNTVSSIDSDEFEDEDYFQKFNTDIRRDIINDWHPESIQVNYDEVNTLCDIVKNDSGVILDPFHKTVPILSKFEKTRVLGLRAKQINEGAKPFIELNQSNYDGYLIACQELAEKKIPFIIRRPMPNGSSEYWRLKDLEILN